MDNPFLIEIEDKEEYRRKNSQRHEGSEMARDAFDYVPLDLIHTDQISHEEVGNHK